MASSREVLTIQLGHYANFVGSHLWNIQDSSFVYSDEDVTEATKEINHHVLYREGKTLTRQQTFTPRLIAVDLKGSLHSLKEAGPLYDGVDEDNEVLWPGDVTLHTEQAKTKSSYLQELEEEEGGGSSAERGVPRAVTEDKDEQPASTHMTEHSTAAKNASVHNLDRDVRVWSDYLRPYLHPKSVTVVKQYCHTENNQDFNVHGLGEQLLCNSSFAEELEAKLHFFIEDCDHIQGIQVFVDTNNGFGGLASAMLEQIDDEYGIRSAMVCGLHPAHTQYQSKSAYTATILNSALSYNLLFDASSAFLPLSLTPTPWDYRTAGDIVRLPYVNYQNIPYHTSSILAATLDTCTLPYRLCDIAQRCTMRDMCDALTTCGRKMLSTNVTLPYALRDQSCIARSLIDHGGNPLWTSVTPFYQMSDAATSTPHTQSVVVRGFATDRYIDTKDRELSSMLGGATSPRDVIAKYLDDVYPSCMNATHIATSRLNTSKPYPQIWDSLIGKQGELMKKPYTPTGVEAVPVVTSLQCSPASHTLVSSLHKHCKRVNLKTCHHFIEAGLDQDRLNETLEQLASKHKLYDTRQDDMT